MKVAVTGASGHLGANLVRQLLERGDDVVTLVRNDTRGIDGLPVRRVNGDIQDAETLDAAFAGSDWVFHCAGYISIETRMEPHLWRTNVEGVRNIVDSCSRTGVKRLIHFSSIHALATDPQDEVIDETRALAEGEHELPYSRAKAAGEREIMAGVERGLDAVIVNPTGVIGPYDYKLSRVGKVIADLACGRMPAVIPGGYNWVDARDASSGAILAAEKGRKGERYLLGGHWCSVRDLAKLVEKVAGRKAPRLMVPMWLARFAAPFSAAWAHTFRKRPNFTPGSLRVLRENSNISSNKAMKELNYSPRPLEETVSDTIAWQKEYFRK